MLSTLILALVLPATAPAFVPPSNVPALQEETPAEDLLPGKLAAAGQDPDALWEVYLWCKQEKRNKDARAVLRSILDVDADHEEAHKGLRHHYYDNQWFDSYVKLSEYKRAEEARMLEEQGVVRFEDGWAKPEDVPFMRMGWVKDAHDRWVHPNSLARSAQEAKFVELGYKRQADMTWVAPDEQAKWEEKLVKVGDEWMSAADANVYHSRLGQWWEYPGEAFIVKSTLDYEGTRWAAWYADQTYTDLVRIFGKKPASAPDLVVLNGVDQYNRFAVGDPESGLPSTEVDGFSSVHYAFFAETWVDLSGEVPEYMGTGVCYWDRGNEALKLFGQYAIRHAAAQAYIEEIDPSWQTISRLVASQGGQGQNSDDFWAEKQIPRWLRYGAASYVERYFKDPDAQPGSEWRVREWALENLREGEGPRPIEQIFAFPLDVNDIEGSGKLIGEAGLLVSFMLDGDCKPVKAAHMAFKSALRSGEGVGEAAQALQQAILDNEDALRMYANI